MIDSLDSEQVLSVCVDRLRAGESVEDCLADYPSHVEQLAPLLRLAARLQAPSGLSMSSAGFDAGQARMLGRAAQLRARPQASPAPTRRGALVGLLAGTRRLAVAGFAGLLLLCSVVGAGTVSAASGSLPGSPLYPVKLATEGVVSSVALTPELQTRVHLAWADRRLREMETLLERNGVVDESLLTALGQETERALNAAEQAGIEQLRAAVGHTKYQQVVLGRVRGKAPAAAQRRLIRALEASTQRHERARSALERAAGQGPPATPPGKAKDKEAEDAEPVGLPADNTSDGPAATPEAQDDAGAPGKGQGQGQSNAQDELEKPGGGQGQDKVKDPNRGPGRDYGQGPDRSGGSNPGRGYGYGRDKDKPNLQGVGPGVTPGLEEEPGRGQNHEKGDRKDNPKESKEE